MPRRNNRDRRFEPREYDSNRGSNYDESAQETKKPVRKRKGKNDKNIYRNDNE